MRQKLAGVDSLQVLFPRCLQASQNTKYQNTQEESKERKLNHLCTLNPIGIYLLNTYYVPGPETRGVPIKKQ